MRFTTVLFMILLLTGCDLFDSSNDGGRGHDEPVDVRLSWTAPETRVDGSPLELSSLTGFNVYRGDAPDTLDLVHRVTDRDVTQHVLHDVGPGTHYFAVTAVARDDLEGPKSEVVSVDVP